MCGTWWCRFYTDAPPSKIVVYRTPPGNKCLPVAHQYGTAFMGFDECYQDPGPGDLGQDLHYIQYRKGELPPVYAPTGHYCGSADQWLNGSQILTAPLLGWTGLGASLCCLIPLPPFQVGTGGEDEGGEADQYAEPFHLGEGGEDDGGSSVEDGILTICCPDRTLPRTLYATITDDGGCSCLSSLVGVPVVMTFVPIGDGGYWYAEVPVPCGPYGTLHFRLSCLFPDGWKFAIDADEFLFGGRVTVAAAVDQGGTSSCHPFSYSTFLLWEDLAGYTGDYCPLGQVVAVTVTE